MNALARLILQHLDKSGGYALPDEGLFSELSVQVRPPATRVQFDDVIIDLQEREMISHLRDSITDEKKYFIKEKGQAALRRI